MIIWVLSGIISGWLLAARLRVDTLCMVLLSSVAVPLVIFLALRRVDLDTIIGYAAFWATVQASYLLCNLHLADTPEETSTPGGLHHV